MTVDIRVGDRAYVAKEGWCTITEVDHCISFRFPSGEDSAAVTGRAFLLIDHAPLRPEDRVIVRQPTLLHGTCMSDKWMNGERLALVTNSPTAGQPNAYVELAVIVQRTPTVLSERAWCRPWQIIEVQHQAPTRDMED